MYLVTRRVTGNKERYRKPLLCRLKLHKPCKYPTTYTSKLNNGRTWNSNYIVCTRCGKKLRRVTWKGGKLV